MTRWTQSDLERFQARPVGPTGTVSTHPVPICARVSKPRKFQNKTTLVDDIPFDSIAEARRYNELKLLKLAGELADLELQPKFALVVNGEKVCTYIADFSYKIRGSLVVEDVKSQATKTRQYRIKVKLLKALTGIEVREVF